MTDFPTLQPAFTVLVTIDPPLEIGAGSRGATLNVAPMTRITLKSEPGFSPAIDAESVGTGNDYIRNDPSGKHMRLNAHAVIKDKSSAMVYLNYTGVVNITPELRAVLGGRPDAKSTPFGDSFVEMKFETGDERFKELETSMFVGSGRFVVEAGEPAVVEYKMSKVVGT